HRGRCGGGKQPVHDVVVLACTIVDELGATLGAEDKGRRHLALTNAAWKFDEDLGAVVEGGGGFGDRIVPAQGDQLVLRVLPGDRGHVGLLGGAQLQVIGTAVGVDDQIGDTIPAG